MKGILFSIRGYQNSLSKKQFKVCCSTVAAPVIWTGLGKEIFGVIFYDLFLHGGGATAPWPHGSGTVSGKLVRIFNS